MKPTFNQLFGIGPDGIRKHFEALDQEIALHRRRKRFWLAVSILILTIWVVWMAVIAIRLES